MEELWRFDLTMRKILDCFVVKCFREEEVLENPRDAFRISIQHMRAMYRPKSSFIASR